MKKALLFTTVMLFTASAFAQTITIIIIIITTTITLAALDSSLRWRGNGCKPPENCPRKRAALIGVGVIGMQVQCRYPVVSRVA